MCYKSFQSVAPVSAGFMHAFIVIKRIRRLFQNLPKTILARRKVCACKMYAVFVDTMGGWDPDAAHRPYGRNEYYEVTAPLVPRSSTEGVPLRMFEVKC